MPHILRIWRGKTPLNKADEYAMLMRTLAAPDYGKCEGLVCYRFARTDHSDHTEFVLITEWTSLDAIKQFAGEDYAKAKYYPEDNAYLLELPETVEHFEVFDSNV